MSGHDLNAATIRGDFAAVQSCLKAGVSPDYADMSHNGAQPLRERSSTEFQYSCVNISSELHFQIGSTMAPTSTQPASVESSASHARLHSPASRQHHVSIISCSPAPVQSYSCSCTCVYLLNLPPKHACRRHTAAHMASCMASAPQRLMHGLRTGPTLESRIASRIGDHNQTLIMHASPWQSRIPARSPLQALM